MGNNTLLGRVPPQAIPLEEAVLGAILLYREAFGIVSGLLRAEHFYKNAHQIVYAACNTLALKNEPIDLLTVTQQMKSDGTLEKAGGAEYLVILTTSIASAANIEHHARIIVQKYMQRSIAVIAEQVREEAYGEGCDPFELIDTAMAQIMGITAPFDVVKSTVTVGQAAQHVMQEVDRQMSGQGEAITTGFATVNRLAGGFMPGEMTVIAARPGMGKTQVAIQAAMAAADSGKQAHFVTLEMTAQQLTRRIMSKISGVGTGEIRRGGLDIVKVKALQDAAVQLVGKTLTISAHRSPNALWAFVRRAAAKKEIDILFVDYAQLMEVEDMKKSANREQEISAISRMMKRISTEFNIPVVLLAQLSREVEKRGDKSPVLSDLRESGSLEQDPDNVWFLVRYDQYGIMEVESPQKETVPTSGKIFLYSKKMRSDSQFWTHLEFVNGHILDRETSAQFPAFEPGNVPRGNVGGDVPF